MEKVFIGMTTYNGEGFIREALDSLINQSYQNWTMLISDDASTDSTKLICEEYVKKDVRITYHLQNKNIGQFENFKFVLDKANGKYFMWAGHDDVWEKDFIHTCVGNFEKYPDRGVSFTNHNVINQDNSVAIQYPHFPNLSGRKCLKTVAKFVLNPEILGKPNIMYSLFKLDCAKKAFFYYPQQKKWGSDILFSLAAISHCGIIIDKKILFHKRLGGYSDPEKKVTKTRKIVLKNPKNHMFPIGGGRFYQYLTGHKQALADTPYYPFVFAILLVRSIRAIILHLKTRNYKKYINQK